MARSSGTALNRVELWGFFVYIFIYSQMGWTPPLRDKIRERAIGVAGEADSDASAQHKRQRARLSQLANQSHELIRMRAQQLITDREFLAHKERLSMQQMALEGQPEKTVNADQ